MSPATSPTTSRVFVASRNPKKIAEIQRILSEQMAEVEVLGLDDVDFYPEPVENAPDFVGNALIKARTGFAATGLPTVADDSGLCVDALNGMPGVLSARWSGPPKSDERNNDLLLAQLADVEPPRRGAHFVCAVAFVAPAPLGRSHEITVQGRMDGRVVDSPRGSGGFGYDCVFEADQRPGLTTAELSVEDKDAISHRGRALREIAPLIAEVLR